MILSFSRTWRSSFGARSSTEQVRKKSEQLQASRKGCRAPVRQVVSGAVGGEPAPGGAQLPTLLGRVSILSTLTLWGKYHHWKN